MRSTFSNWYQREMREDPERARETEAIEDLLQEIDTIALVGISRSVTKDSYYVGRYLQKRGYRVLPVNPKADKILGQQAYNDLHEITEPIDVVDLFLPKQIVPKAVDQALELDPLPRAIWLQLGVESNDDIRKKVEKEGIRFVRDRCMKVDHQFLVRPKQSRRASQQNY